VTEEAPAPAVQDRLKVPEGALKLQEEEEEEEEDEDEI
jgi:hypothetical protein